MISMFSSTALVIFSHLIGCYSFLGRFKTPTLERRTFSTISCSHGHPSSINLESEFSNINRTNSNLCTESRFSLNAVNLDNVVVARLQHINDLQNSRNHLDVKRFVTKDLGDILALLAPLLHTVPTENVISSSTKSELIVELVALTWLMNWQDMLPFFLDLNQFQACRRWRSLSNCCQSDTQRQLLVLVCLCT